VGLAPRQSLNGRTARKTSEELAQERLLHGAPFMRESGARFSAAGSVVPNSTGSSSATLNSAAPSLGALDPDAPSAFTGALSNTGSLGGSTGGPMRDADNGTIEPFLRPTAIASVHAKVLPTRRFLLPKGAFVDCTLETAIDSTLPGMTTCITATDTFSADGTVVLLERGTKLIGETRGQVQQGAARVFVLWTEARTPTGIVVPLDSPGTDELGRSGLPGSVNRHFWDRFGAAILISTLDGAVQASVQSAGRGGGAIIYNPSNSETVLTDVLKSTVNIPPTISKANGDRIQVFVARDVDFRTVYELRSATTAQ
jgi:type IV secretion system protein VirB10